MTGEDRILVGLWVKGNVVVASLQIYQAGKPPSTHPSQDPATVLNGPMKLRGALVNWYEVLTYTKCLPSLPLRDQNKRSDHGGIIIWAHRNYSLGVHHHLQLTF